jgi:hypothetical protein
MKAGTLNVKIVTRNLQGSKGAYQFMLLAGFTPALSHNNADYVETLSPARILQQSEINNIIAKLITHSNAATHKFITPDSVQKKLDKLFEEPEGAALEATFEDMGINVYL